jgi:hypothetical protein
MFAHAASTLAALLAAAPAPLAPAAPAPIQIQRKNNRIAVHSPKTPAGVEAFRAVAGATFDWRSRAWTFPADAAHAVHHALAAAYPGERVDGPRGSFVLPLAPAAPPASADRAAAARKAWETRRANAAAKLAADRAAAAPEASPPRTATCA